MGGVGFDFISESGLLMTKYTREKPIIKMLVLQLLWIIEVLKTMPNRRYSRVISQ